MCKAIIDLKRQWKRQARKEEYAEGYAERYAEGYAEGLRGIIERMLKKNLSVLEICDLTGTTKKTVNEISLALQY